LALTKHNFYFFSCFFLWPQKALSISGFQLASGRKIFQIFLPLFFFGPKSRGKFFWGRKKGENYSRTEKWPQKNG